MTAPHWPSSRTDGERRSRGARSRNLRDNKLEPGGLALTRAAECRQAFSKERWEAFRQDVDYFRTRVERAATAALPDRSRLQRDPSVDGHRPLHQLSARPRPDRSTRLLAHAGRRLSRRLPASHRLGLRSRGGRAGSARLGRRAYLGLHERRWIWIVLAVRLAVRCGRGCLPAQKADGQGGRFRTGRQQPAAGVSCGTLLRAGRARPLPARAAIAGSMLELRRILLGSLVGLALLVPFSILGTNSGSHGDFVRNAAKHAETPLSNYMGLRTMFSWDPELRERLLAEHEIRTTSCGCGSSSATLRSARGGSGTLLAAAALIGLTALLSLRSSETWLITLAGVVPMFCLFELTNYFYAIMALFAVWAYQQSDGMPRFFSRSHSGARSCSCTCGGGHSRTSRTRRWFWGAGLFPRQRSACEARRGSTIYLARSTGPSRRSQSARQLPPFPGV